MDLLNVLGDIEIAVSLKKDQEEQEKKQTDLEVDHILDQQYKQLNNKIEYVDPSSEEYKIVEKYVNETRGTGKQKIIHLFRIDRAGEHERYKQFAHLPNKKLLWHGTSKYNYFNLITL